MSVLLPASFKRDVIHLLNESGFRLLEIGQYSAVPRTMLSGLPDFINNSRLFCSAYNLIDTVLAALLPFLTQNIFFIASKE